MSFTDFKEITVNNPGTSLRYGGNDLKQIMEIFNAKIASNKRPKIINEWIWMDHFDMAPPAIAPASPLDTNASRIYIDPANFKVKVKKTSGTILDIENVDIPYSALNLGGNIVNADINAAAAIAWAKIDKTGSILDNIGDVALTSPQNNDVLLYSSGQWINASGIGAGETNTVSNIGTAGIGWFKQKVGVNFEFKKINALSNKLILTDDTTNNKVDIDVDQANLNLESIGGSITTRSKIPSATVYDDEANTYGEFDQLFRSGRLKIRNPADTFDFILAAGAITANTTVTLPNTAATSDVFMLAGATSQNITGSKRFSSDQLKIWNPAVTFNYSFRGAAITANRIAILPLLTADDTFVMEAFAQVLTNKSISAASNTLTNIGDAAIAAHTSTKITITDKLLLNTQIFYKDADNDVGDHFIDFGDMTAPASPAANSRRLFCDAANADELSIKKSDGTVVSLESGGGAGGTLDALTDVVAPTPTLNHVLTFDGTNWVNAAPPGATGGEANTGSNVGAAGVGVFRQKVGVDLRFKKIAAGTNKITITDNVGNDTVEVDVGEANLDLNSIGGSISTRSKLPTPLVYDDEANTYGDFDQVFRSSRVKIRNPANTFGYTIIAGAIAADRNLTLPLLAGNDTFVTEAFAQTLSNKTFDAAANILSNVGDSHIATHTSTKISITNKMQLNSALVYNDQANVFGAFDQSFLTNRLILKDSDNSHGYLFAGSNLTANRTVTLPLLGGNDTFVMEAFAQTLTNKIIDAVNNTISNIGDTNIATHASSKITITNKAQLNGAIAYTDQTNTFASANTFSAAQTFVSYLDIKKIAAPGNPALEDARLAVEAVDANNNGLFLYIKQQGAIVKVRLYP